MKLAPLALAFAAFTFTAPALAQDDLSQKRDGNVVARAASPDGRITVTVSIDGEGRASYAVQRAGKPLLADSRLGFLFTDAPKLDRNLALVEVKRDKADTSWTQPFGEWTTIRDNHNEMTVRLREKADLAREMDVTFRIFDDGIGFRYSYAGIPDGPDMFLDMHRASAQPGRADAGWAKARRGQPFRHRASQPWRSCVAVQTAERRRREGVVKSLRSEPVNGWVMSRIDTNRHKNPEGECGRFCKCCIKLSLADGSGFVVFPARSASG